MHLSSGMETEQSDGFNLLTRGRRFKLECRQVHSLSSRGRCGSSKLTPTSVSTFYSPPTLQDTLDKLVNDMMPTVCIKAFGITEPCERIVSEAVQGERVMQDLFALQRVNRNSNDMINGSKALRILMCLEHADDEWNYPLGAHSRAITVVQDQIGFLQF